MKTRSSVDRSVMSTSHTRRHARAMASSIEQTATRAVADTGVSDGGPNTMLSSSPCTAGDRCSRWAIRVSDNSSPANTQYWNVVMK